MTDHATAATPAGGLSSAASASAAARARLRERVTALYGRRPAASERTDVQR